MWETDRWTNTQITNTRLEDTGISGCERDWVLRSRKARLLAEGGPSRMLRGRSLLGENG